MKTLIHIIPTLENGGAETVLTRLVEEFSVGNVRQIVINIQGSEKDFNHSQISMYCEVIHAKEDFTAVKKVFQKHPKATILAWMYKAIVKAHQWKQAYQSDQTIIWNIRRSSFRSNEIYQKASLFVLGVFSKILKTPILYCAYEAKKVHNRFGFYQGKSRVIQNGLAKKMNFENTGSSPIDGDYFLYVGRYNLAKGPDRLLEIAQSILPHHPNHSLLIAGNGWTKEMIPPSLTKQVVLLGNMKELVPLYSHATALLFTSYTEGYPNVLVEAAVCGTPIIGFSAGDSPSMLANYTLGYLVDNNKRFCVQVQNLIKEPIPQNERVNAAKKAKVIFDFKQTYIAYHEFIFT